MLRTGKSYLRDSDDDKPIVHAAGGSARQQAAPHHSTEGHENAPVTLEIVRALLDEQSRSLLAVFQQAAPPQR